MPLFNRFTRISAGGASLTRPTKSSTYQKVTQHPSPASAAPPGKDSGRSAACVPGGASLTRPTTPFIYQKATQHPTPGKRSRRGAACVPGGASLTRPTKSFTYQKATQHPSPASAAPPGKDSGRGAASVPGGGYALPGLQRHLPIRRLLNTPARQAQQARSRLCAGWRLRLTRPVVRATCR